MERARPPMKFVTADTFAALVRLYISSNPKWPTYSESTRATWGRELNFAAHPDCLGAVSIQEIRPSLVQRFMDGISHKPGKQSASLRALQSPSLRNIAGLIWLASSHCRPIQGSVAAISSACAGLTSKFTMAVKVSTSSSKRPAVAFGCQC